MSTETRSRSRIIPALAVTLLGLSAASNVRAQATLTTDNPHAEADVFWYDSGFFYHGNGWSHSDSPSVGMDWSDTRSSAYTNTGFSGTASGHNTTAYSPSNPGAGGAFNSVRVNLTSDAAISASDLTGAHFFEDSYSKSWTNLVVTLSQPTNWSWEADVAGSCSTNGWDNNAYYWFRIYDVTNTVEYVDNRRRTNNGDANYNEHISLSGVLPAGSFNVYIQVTAECANFSEVGGGVGTASSTLGGVFSVPAPGSAALFGLACVAIGRRRR